MANADSAGFGDSDESIALDGGGLHLSTGKVALREILRQTEPLSTNQVNHAKLLSQVRRGGKALILSCLRHSYGTHTAYS